MNRPTVPDLLAVWAPGVTRILIMPVGGTSMARAWGDDQELLRINRDEHRMLLTVLRHAYPTTDWTVAQTWSTADGIRPTATRLGVAA